MVKHGILARDKSDALADDMVPWAIQNAAALASTSYLLPAKRNNLILNLLRLVNLTGVGLEVTAALDGHGFFEQARVFLFEGFDGVFFE